MSTEKVKVCTETGGMSKDRGWYIYTNSAGLFICGANYDRRGWYSCRNGSNNDRRRLNDKNIIITTRT
jgi:hypothetical protein